MKKVSFSFFALLFCLLFINTQPQFAAVSSEGKGKILAKRGTSIKNPSQSTIQKQTNVWQQVSDELLKSETHGLPDPEKYLVFRLNKTALTQVLADVPSELKKVLPETSVIMELPMPDGSFARVRIEESSVLEPGLAAKFPEIKSYRGQGIDDPTLTTRFDWTPQGFHAILLSGSQTINLEPANVGDSSLYISYFGDDLKADEIECLVEDFHELNPQEIQRDVPQVAVGPTLRNYRIAIAATFEYAQNYGGGTVAGTVSSLNTWLNNANAVYERELSVHLNLANSTNVIYSADRGFTATSDPYDNSNVGSMLDVVRGNLSSNVGTANYDLGHVFGYISGTGGSGVAYIGVVCQNFAYSQPGEIKGGGSTLVGGSVGNSTALGVWVHELGHQFGANHNFNGTLSNCGSGNHNNATSYESGSGLTIMGYSGICGADNITYSRDMRFHAMSYAAINSYINTTSCAMSAPTGNGAPTVSGGGNRNIPKNTPFTLTAAGSDPNGDGLTYTWDQIDAGGASYPQNGTEASYSDAGDPSATTRPIFRPFAASISASRTFPSLNYILNSANDPPDTVGGLKTAEELPRVGRTLNFRVMARDNKAGGGGVNEDTVTLTVDGNSGPFLVASPNTSVSLTGGNAQTVTWSVNNTNIAPISAANIKISLSTDGGNTFPTVLAASTTNDGSESVVLPNITTTTARIKVEAVGNIFFDINDTNFSITAGTSGGQGLESDVADRFTGDGVYRANDAVQIERFLIFADSFNTTTNEFQRADCAPYSTRGDGSITIADVQLAEQYLISAVAQQTAGGLTQAVPPPAAEEQSSLSLIGNGKSASKVQKAALLPRVVKAGDVSTSAGATITVPILVDAEGDETGYSFTLDYDPNILTNTAVLAGDVGGTRAFVIGDAPNNGVPKGKTTFSLRNFTGGPNGNAVPTGNGQVLVRVQFTVNAGAMPGTTPLTFSGSPTPNSVTNANSQLLATQFNPGTVTITGPTAAGAVISGRVQNGTGRGVANAQIVMTNNRGEKTIARSNGFGYFRFADVPSGETYTVTVKSKQYKFTPKVINVTQDLTDLILTAQPRE